MANGDQSRRKCFTLIWKVENASYRWHCGAEFIESPEFTVDEISKTKWKLQLDFNVINKHSGSCLYLQRYPDGNDEEVELGCELACVSSNGKVLHSFEEKNAVIGKENDIGSDEFPSLYDVFFARRSEFLTQDTLTVRCKMWKGVGEISKNVHCFACTRIAVEKCSVIWNIEDFSNLESDESKTYEIKSLGDGEQLMKLQLWLTGWKIIDETIRLKIIPNYNIIKTSTLQLSIIDAYNNTEKCLLGEFAHYESIDSKEFTPFYTKRELLEKKNTYLPNNVLSLLCECTFSSGKFEYEIQFGSSNRPTVKNQERDKKNELATPKIILINDFKKMLNNSEFADVKLKTRNKTYSGHKLVLSYRSPVFKAMFSNNMKENIKDCVEIDDLSGDTVLDMLRYIYCADVEDLEWGRAIQLYEAADKYQILNLKDICSSYLKINLCRINACETLVLADLHQDVDLKLFVQDFILKDGEKIVNSEEWEELMETHLKLAAERNNAPQV